jgi:Asp-tRNA(Asn)/Glu-tRNA(Gln) amidotransferase C subunit
MAENFGRAGKVAGRDAAKVARVEADQAEATALHTRIAPILEKVDQLGENDPDFDMKVFTDEMWGG